MRRLACFIIILAAIFSFRCMDSLDNAIPAVPNDAVKSAVVNGRIFYYIEPVTLPPAGGYPVVLCFHGGDGYAKHWVSLSGIGLSGFGNLALARGYFLLAPESGISDDPSGSFSDVKKRWDTGINSRDITFVLDIVDWLAGSGYYVNLARVFGVGISSGGAMVSRMSQSVPPVFRRVSIVASINPSYGYVPATQTVNNDHPSALFVHGTADALTPYDRMLEYYIALQDSHAVAAGPTDTDARVVYLITIPGGGHTWFGAYNSDILDWFDSAP